MMDLQEGEGHVIATGCRPGLNIYSASFDMVEELIPLPSTINLKTYVGHTFK